MTDKTPLTLYRGQPPHNNFVWSPFATKLEARLRFASKPYTLAAGAPTSAPKGKVPYVELSPADGGDKIGDSTFIVKHLIDRGAITDLNASISPLQRAQDLAIRAMLEDRVYFLTAKEKWVDNYTTMRDGILTPVPWPLRLLVGYMVQRANIRTFYGQGVLRHSDEQITILKEEVWESVDALLKEARKKNVDSDTPFWVLGGDEPTEADTTMFGFIVGALVCTAAPETMKIVKSYPVIVEYAQRIRDAYFPDYEQWE